MIYMYLKTPAAQCQHCRLCLNVLFNDCLNSLFSDW